MKKINKSLILFLFIFSKLFLSTGQSVVEINRLVSGNNTFAFDLYSELKSEKGNLLFSPYSISTAFAILYGGTKATTAKQISTVFNFPDDDKVLGESFNYLYSHLTNKKQVVFELANSLWLNKSSSFIKRYTKQVETHYNVDIKRVDFKKDSITSTIQINNWVKEKTKENIINIYDKPVDTETEFIIINAFYFYGTWKYRFENLNTKDEYFYPNCSQAKIASIEHENMIQFFGLFQDGSEIEPSIGLTHDGVQVKLMSQRNLFKYGEDSNFQWLELPYSEESVTMLIFLPKNDDGINFFEESINPRKLNGFIGQMSLEEVEVFLPRFSFRHSVDVIPKLRSMGISDAFEPDKANLNGIVKEVKMKPKVYINDVRHDVCIDVNETGTEAIAVTAISGVRGGLEEAKTESKIFMANHPFIFFIIDRNTESILFIGRMMNLK